MVFTDNYFQPLQFIGDASGLTMDKVNTLSCVIAAYPLGLLFRQLPLNANLRHFVAGAIGLAFCFLCFREECLHLVVQMVMTYLIMQYGGANQHRYAFVYCMLHLSCNNLFHRVFHWGEWALNVNGPLMILTQKLTQLAFSVHDGERPDEEMAKKPFLNALKLTKKPNFLEVFGYSFSFFGVMLGPSHQYIDYENAVKGKVNGKDIPSGIMYGLRCMFLAVAWFALQAFAPGQFGSSGDPKHLSIGALTETGAPNPVHDYTMLGKYGHIMLAMIVYRCSFYFAWGLAEGACSFAGLGYDGDADKATGEAKGWGKICNVHPLSCEFAVNMKQVLDNWNCQTQKWLRIVCYERTGSVNQTMLLSAVWHGPYLGYLMTFGTGAIVTEAARKIRRTVRPFFANPEGSALHRVYDVITWVATLSMLNYMTGPFVCLTAQESHDYFNAFYYAPHVLVIAVLVLMPGKPKKPKADKKEEKKAE